MSNLLDTYFGDENSLEDVYISETLPKLKILEKQYEINDNSKGWSVVFGDISICE